MICVSSERTANSPVICLESNTCMRLISSFLPFVSTNLRGLTNWIVRMTLVLCLRPSTCSSPSGPILPPSCANLSRSGPFVSTRVLGFGDRLSHMENICHAVQAHVEICAQNQMLFGSPTHEFLDFHQNRLEFLLCGKWAEMTVNCPSIQLDRNPSCCTTNNPRLSAPFLR